MDILEKEFISKFVINDENIYCMVCWTNNETALFTIHIFGQCETSFGTFPRDKAKKFSQHLDENEEDYSKNVMNAIKGLDDSFIFDMTRVENSTTELRFCWKRKIPGGYLLHGELTLQIDEPALSKDHIAEFLINQNKALQSLMEDLMIKKDTLRNEKEKYMKELEGLVDIKNSVETFLYGKFVKVLNAKKRRIQLLESQLFDSNEDMS